MEWNDAEDRRLAVLRAMAAHPGISREGIMAETGLTYEQVREAMTIEYGPADEDEY